VSRREPDAADATEPRYPSIPPVDEAAREAARERQSRLTKPPGSLGRLEDAAVEIAGLVGDPRPALADPAVVVAAGDHGVAAEGVSAYPQSVTRGMLANFADGGAAVNALAGVVGAETVVVDMGVAGDPVPGAVDVRIGRGTDNAAEGPAMSRAAAVAAVEAGVDLVADHAPEAGAVCLGEMGIGNTTAATAITAALTDAAVGSITGRGTGIDAETRREKVAVVEAALATTEPDPADPIDVLRCVGGYEIAGLVGVALGAAARRTPVVVDGVVSGAAALVAAELDGRVEPYLLPSHAGSEPGHAVQLDALGLEPLFDHALRLGEGTGACLALAHYRGACATLRGMATFEEAGLG